MVNNLRKVGDIITILQLGKLRTKRQKGTEIWIKNPRKLGWRLGWWKKLKIVKNEWLWTKLWPIGKYTSHWELTRQKLNGRIFTKKLEHFPYLPSSDK